MNASRLCLPLLLALAAAGCAGGALEAMGLRRPAAAAGARTVAVRLQAADDLNAGARGQPLALVARIYQLRQREAFESAPYAAFLDPQAEKQALGADLLAVTEVTLVPGQRRELAEIVAREAGYIGIVALFHAPAPKGWRAAFAAEAAERHGMAVGLHACALSASGPPATTAPSSVHCQ